MININESDLCSVQACLHALYLLGNPQTPFRAVPKLVRNPTSAPHKLHLMELLRRLVRRYPEPPRQSTSSTLETWRLLPPLSSRQAQSSFWSYLDHRGGRVRITKVDAEW